MLIWVLGLMVVYGVVSVAVYIHTDNLLDAIGKISQNQHFYQEMKKYEPRPFVDRRFFNRVWLKWLRQHPNAANELNIEPNHFARICALARYYYVFTWLFWSAFLLFILFFQANGSMSGF